MRRSHSYAECIALAEHYKAVGQNEIYLDRDGEFPWHLATEVTAGGSYRLNGLSSARVLAVDPKTDLKFSWHFDFEGQEANGTGVNQFDAKSMIEAARNLPVSAREQFARLLHDEVLTGVRKRTEEVRDALRKQEDSLQVLQSIIIATGAAA